MTTCEHGWVVCAPGDPTELQWEVIRSLAGTLECCAEEWHADTGAVGFSIYTPRYGALRFMVSLSGQILERTEGGT